MVTKFATLMKTLLQKLLSMLNQYVFKVEVKGIDVPLNVIGVANNEGCARENAKRELIKKFHGKVDIVKMTKVSIIKGY